MSVTLLQTQTINKPFHTDYLKFIRQDIYNLSGYVSNSILERNETKENVLESIKSLNSFELIDSFIPTLVSLLYDNLTTPEVINRVYKDTGNVKRVGKEDIYYLFNGIRVKVLDTTENSFTYTLLIDTEGSSYLIPNNPKYAFKTGKEN
jgi:hypothetical protein|nr:MAG TPA: hypothetical protein [Caudoviricetes sp.]